MAASVVLSTAGLNRIDRTTLAPTKLALITANEILAPLAESIQEELARSLVEVKVPAGEAVVEEGMAGDRFYLIESGTAEVTAHGKVVNRLGPGDSFGEIALLRDVPRQATVRACRGSHALRLGTRGVPRRGNRPQRGQPARQRRRLPVPRRLRQVASGHRGP